MADDTGNDEGNQKVHNKKDAKRQKIIIGAAIAGVVLTVILIFRSKANANAASNTTSANAIDPNTGIPYAQEVAGAGAIDPNTGIPYAEEVAGATGPMGTTDNSGYDAQQLYGIEQELGALQGQISANSSNAGGGASTPSPGNSNTAPGKWSPTNLPSSLMATMQRNGEYITDVVEGGGGDTLYLTQKGGVYDIGAGGTQGHDFYGSVLGLSNQTQSGIRGTFNKLTVRKGGGYTLTDTTGQNYSF